MNGVLPVWSVFFLPSLLPYTISSFCASLQSFLLHSPFLTILTVPVPLAMLIPCLVLLCSNTSMSHLRLQALLPLVLLLETPLEGRGKGYVPSMGPGTLSQN